VNNFKLKKCKCGKEFKQYNSLNSYCSFECKNKFGKPANLKLKDCTPIKKVSDKRKELNKIYESVRIEILSESKFKCFIDGCTNVANTVEHLMGRKGFADQWAKDNNIPLLIDKRYLRPCCLVHNGELETNPELAKKYQYSKISGIKKSEL
jgi:hypothetical protein